MTTIRQIDIKEQNIRNQVEKDLHDEPYLLTYKRVENLLDIGVTTRKNLIKSGDLVRYKNGNNMQSKVRITKPSVINVIVKWATAND